MVFCGHINFSFIVNKWNQIQLIKKFNFYIFFYYQVSKLWILLSKDFSSQHRIGNLTLLIDFLVNYPAWPQKSSILAKLAFFFLSLRLALRVSFQIFTPRKKWSGLFAYVWNKFFRFYILDTSFWVFVKSAP